MSWLPPPHSWARFFFLLLSKTLDTLFFTTRWRSLWPSVLGDLPRVPYPTYPDMTFYAEVPGGIWEFLRTPNTTLSCLTSVLNMTVTLPLLVLLLFKINSFYEPMMSNYGRILAEKSHGKEWVAKNPEKIQKFGEYSYRLAYHTFVSLYAVVAFRDMPWFHDTREMWTNYFTHPVTVGLTWYTLLQCSYNIQQLVKIGLMSFERRRAWPYVGRSPLRRGDFREMFLHHVVTNALVLSSSYFRITRSGTMVMILHDLSDIPVDLSKLANFLKWKRATAACFAVMLGFWIFFRLYYFPAQIIWSGT
uniref:TLC domain-containing protein n=1 Tax=Corethron hystrix TaxID=216773 RepID=A0A7S1BSX1_9STRA|mmetsp:Transcript_3990/g.7632  ORF Transcript_3990/g.7632 Transcript_3990/m.7632 type:complete len:304 (+) Transcript_3990:38-949(+)